jgi:NAD(P)-dependent dehydrogenase (short-subunit alcohol dehydrogenase family)
MILGVTERFGQLDILCNSAGIDGQLSPLQDCSEENLDNVLSVNLKGVFFGIKHGSRQWHPPADATRRVRADVPR